MNQIFRTFFIFAVAIMYGFSLHAFELQEYWNDQNQKMIRVACFEDSTACDILCQNDKLCDMPEPSCSDCVGTSILMTYFFQEMGRYIRSTSNELDHYALLDLLSSRRFISLSSKSVYNHIDSFNSPSLQRRFRSLCQDGTPTPVVFFEQLASRKIGQPLMVWCETGVYEVINQAELEEFLSPLH